MLADAENYMIPYLRAKYDGNNTHDKITWVVQTERHVEAVDVGEEEDGWIGVKMVPTESLWLMCMLQIDGIMFHVKARVPDFKPEQGKTDQQVLMGWVEHYHRVMLYDLLKQMRDFAYNINKHAADLSRMLVETDNH